MESLSPKNDAVDSASGQFIGLMLNWGLHGILIAQTSTYHTTFPRDAWINKAIVGVVFSLETLQTTLLTYELYQSFVRHFGDVEYLELLGLMWLAVPVLCGIVGWIAEMFYAYRIYKISKSRKISAFIIALAFIQLGTAIAEGMRARTAQNMVDLRLKEEATSILTGVLWVISMVACDVTIAIVMTYCLVKLRRELTDSAFLIRRLMALTVETGTVTAFAAILAGTLFVGKPDSETFNIPGFIIGKLYSNSLLRVLNNRRNRVECVTDIISTMPISEESRPTPQSSAALQNGESCTTNSSARLTKVERGEGTI